MSRVLKAGSSGNQNFEIDFTTPHTVHILELKSVKSLEIIPPNNLEREKGQKYSSLFQKDLLYDLFCLSSFDEIHFYRFNRFKL